MKSPGHVECLCHTVYAAKLNQNFTGICNTVDQNAILGFQKLHVLNSRVIMLTSEGYSQTLARNEYFSSLN